ncbi:MAG: hypothetical protein NUW37_10735 [Planctomycetes bacterium]|nr:hypothetical protein [Planctomycetota bacterium]
MSLFRFLVCLLILFMLGIFFWGVIDFDGLKMAADGFYGGALNDGVLIANGFLVGLTFLLGLALIAVQILLYRLKQRVSFKLNQMTNGGFRLFVVTFFGFSFVVNLSFFALIFFTGVAAVTYFLALVNLTIDIMTAEGFKFWSDLTLAALIPALITKIVGDGITSQNPEEIYTGQNF